MGRVSVVIFIDALGSEVAKRHRFLAKAPGGGRALDTVIGYSSSAIPSLLTGALPRSHGHFSMYRRDLGGGVFAKYRPAMLLAHHTKGRGKLRKFLKNRLSRSLTGYFELYDIPLNVLARFDLCQRNDLFRPDAIPGHETIFDTLASRVLPYRVWTWKDDEARAFDELEAEVAAGTSRFLFLYSARLDAAMHRLGVGHADVGALLEGYQERLDRIRAATSNEMHVTLFSDHGMTDVTGVHDLHTPLDATGLSAPRDYLVFSDSTMARFWFHKKGAEAKIRAALPNTAWGRWLTEDEMRGYGIDFADHRYGEAIYLLEAGHVIVPSFMGLEPVAAMHGYGPEDPTASAWLHTNYEPHVPMRSIRDLRPLLASELDWVSGR